MSLDAEACYRAIVSRDERFDGLFFVAVATTGIYCRPVCRARTPGRDRCHFYRTGAQAEQAGFRACFRCRPELAPGAARIDSVSRIVGEAVRRIDAGALNDGSLEDLARDLGVTDRHLRRVMQAELGTTPIEFAETRRLALAKQLLHDTSLSMTEVAFASGFRSLRRFNAAFKGRFGKPPSELRRMPNAARASEGVRLLLDYRPPFDWEALLEFFRPRAGVGVEVVAHGSYARTVRLGSDQGYVRVQPMAGRPALAVDVSMSLALQLMPLVQRLRRVFDLDAQPKAIAAHLEKDPALRRHLARRPGLRVPGSFDPFELGLRAILGQQVSVTAATTLYGRLVEALGDPIETPHAALRRLPPRPEAVAAAGVAKLVSLGILASRAKTLTAFADAVRRGILVLDPNREAEATVRQLLELPGIGPWTAEYIALRALAWPDAFPDGDLGLRRALGGTSARALKTHAERWRPWRAYAALHLWTGSA